MLDRENKTVFHRDLHGHGLVDVGVHRRKTAGLIKLGDQPERLQSKCRREIANDDRRLDVDDL